MQHTKVKMIDSLNLQEKIVAMSGGAAGAAKAVSDGVTLLPDALLNHLPHWINYSIHCTIGCVVSLTLTHIYRWLTNKQKSNGN